MCTVEFYILTIREEQLEKNGRQKIRYEKKDNAYWLDGGKKMPNTNFKNQQWLEIVYTQIPANLSDKRNFYSKPTTCTK